jgi:Flp pilus assembly pilin Flp
LLLRRETGAAAVETAVVAPFLLMMVIGIVEFGLYFHNSATASTAVAAGARTAVTQARVDGYQTTVSDSVKAAMRNVSAEPQTLTIFKADPNSGEPTGGTVGKNFNACLADCYRFTWNEATKSWVEDSTVAWLASDQAACGPLGRNDYLGVQLTLKYQSATGLLLENQKIVANSLMRLEPVSSAAGQECES